MKATKAQVQTRVEEVLRIRLDGAEFWDVREYAREKEQEKGSAWELPKGGKPLSDGQLWRYISRADDLIAASCRASRKKQLRRHLAQRRNLFAKAVSQGDIRAALAVLDSEAKLLALFPAAEEARIALLEARIRVLRSESKPTPGPAGEGTGRDPGGPPADAPLPGPG
jgi:hypothetical protein